jgi:hypothetical protein
MRTRAPSRRTPGRPGKLADDQVRRIRRVFDLREKAKSPTDAELAAESGVSVATVRKVGKRWYYPHVPD